MPKKERQGDTVQFFIEGFGAKGEMPSWARLEEVPFEWVYPEREKPCPRERDLWYAVLVDGLTLATMPRPPRAMSKIKQRDINQAVEWMRLFSDQVGGFSWCCTLFGLDATAVYDEIMSVRRRRLEEVEVYGNRRRDSEVGLPDLKRPHRGSRLTRVVPLTKRRNAGGSS